MNTISKEQAKFYLDTLEMGLLVAKENKNIADYRVVCDETNNTEEDKKNKVLNADIYITQNPIIEYIELNITIKEKL